MLTTLLVSFKQTEVAAAVSNTTIAQLQMKSIHTNTTHQTSDWCITYAELAISMAIGLCWRLRDFAVTAGPRYRCRAGTSSILCMLALRTCSFPIIFSAFSFQVHCWRIFPGLALRFCTPVVRLIMLIEEAKTKS